MKLIKEAKENLPISFLTDFISKGWEEVGYLKADIEAIKEVYKGTKPIEELIQNLIDAYLVCIGQLEAHISDKKYIDYPEASGLGLNEDLELKVSDNTVEIKSDEHTELVVDTAKDVVVVSEEEIDDEDSEEEVVIDTKAVEPFEYFVDFDEPDLSEPRLTDKDLYDEN